MSLIENEQGPRRRLAKPVAKPRGVRLIREQAVGNDEPGMGCPRIDGIAPFDAFPLNVFAIVHLEGESEALLELVAPLRYDRRRRGNDHSVDPLAQHQLPKDQSCLDRLAEANIV